MNRFTADYSSSPTNTPPRNKGLFFNEPNISTTPLVPPPSTVFGSSRLGTGKSLFSKPASSPNDSRFVDRTPPRFANTRSLQHQKGISPFSNRTASRQYVEDDGDDDDDEGHEYEEDAPVPVQSLMKFSTNSTKSNRQSVFRRSTRSHSVLPHKGNPDVVPNLARGLAQQSDPAPLEKDDTLILDTELFLQQLNNERHQAQDDNNLQSLLDAQARDLLNLWRSNITQASHTTADLGPPEPSTAFDKAYYLSSLLLTLHHPDHSTLPETILVWLQNHHVSYDPLAQMVADFTPNATAHEQFWDVVLSLTLRGRLQGVMRLLQNADFSYAVSAVLDDNEPEPGFRGAQLQTIQGTVFKVRQVINACPAMKGNWDTASEEWARYRSNVEFELDSLGQLASGEQGDEDEFEAENFGVQKPRRDLLRRSQRSRNLPWSIYQGIRILYGILIGSSTEIITQSQDWLEAACALTVWWDGTSDAQIADWSLAVGRATRSAPPNAGINPYLTRLRDAFLCVTDPDAQETFAINSMSPVEVGLASILQGSVTSALGVMRGLSQCITAAVAELSSAAGWLDSGSRQTGFNQSDLLVLSVANPSGTLTKDDILVTYASELAQHNNLRFPDGNHIDGWEVALSVLSRMDEQEQMNETVDDLLAQLDVSHEERMQRAISLCMDLRFTAQARSMSEKLGDYLSDNTYKYGMALMCYANSHKGSRIRKLTEMLVSNCLVQSRAWPSENNIDETLLALVESPKAAFANMIETDPEAAALLQFYVVGYACIRRVYTYRDNPPEHSKSNSNSGPIASAQRKRLAAKALVAAVNSAADSIYGGLYDSERQTAISHEMLLVLLGEATAFLSQDSPVFTDAQIYALLAAIEDFETVAPHVKEAAEAAIVDSIEQLRSASNSNGGGGREDMLKKSMSSGLTNSTNFSFSMAGSGTSAGLGAGRSEGSAVLVGGGRNDMQDESDLRRQWDWRTAFGDLPDEELPKEVLKRLRLGLARELSMGMLE
ncbi:uncharacterized protein AB675_8118 [Cyphellophora attinorum]|uniref:Nuclear pore complex protein Nup85 n=1 Tax=Cyphellophora attinorum TaxID=1664694 RepID=A0A0N1P177_9EURO|nr:uncharacterized protein AB675_8118 [Phialophora attinorum]KPI41302.1 hypothetical protein AB675_8118 [Phialophora attinorum]